MFKKVILAAAFALASSPAFVSAQDFFFSFDENARVANPTVAAGTTSATAYIFADENLSFSQLDLDFSVSGPASITSATPLSVPGKFEAFDVVDPNDRSSGPTATDGRLFAFSGLQVGQIAGRIDADFRAGANGFLLAEVSLDLAGPGTANFDFTLGDQGIASLFGAVEATFQSATLTVAAVPEPSSAVLLILGAAGMVARRRRS